MKTFFKFLLLLLVVLLALGAVGFAVFRSVAKNSRDAESYVRETIPVVFSDWNVMEFYNRTSPEFKKAMTLDQVYKLFNQGRALGKLEKWSAPTGTAGGFEFFNKSPRIWAHVVTKAEFERGEAELRLGLVRDGDRWEIKSFNVQSPDFPRLAGNPADPSPTRALAAQPLATQPLATQPLATQSQSPLQFGSSDEAQREVVRRYPDIGVAGTRLNQEFVARHKRYKTENPEYFRDAAWPLRLAEEALRAVKGQP